MTRSSNIKFFYKTSFVTRSSITNSATTLCGCRKRSFCVIVRDEDTTDTRQEPTKMDDSFQDRYWHNQSVRWVNTRIVPRTTNRHLTQTPIDNAVANETQAESLSPWAFEGNWAKSIIQSRDHKKVQTNCLTCHTNKKGMAHVTSSGHVAEITKCSRPSQTDVIFVAMDALVERIYVEGLIAKRNVTACRIPVWLIWTVATRQNRDLTDHAWVD